MRRTVSAEKTYSVTVGEVREVEYLVEASSMRKARALVQRGRKDGSLVEYGSWLEHVARPEQWRVVRVRSGGGARQRRGGDRFRARFNLRHDMQSELESLRAFEQDCREAEYTDTGEAWFHLGQMRKLLGRVVRVLGA